MAPNARPEVGDSQGIHARGVFQPAAAPVDTYVRPAPKVLSKGAALLGALEDLDAAFTPVLNKEIRQMADREMAKGEELFEKNRADFATAVKDGTVPPGASPFLRRGYRRSQLHVLGANYTVELNKALETSKIYEVGDPAQVEAFIQKFDMGFREANGVDGLPMKEVNKYFTPLAVNAQDNFRVKQSALNIKHTGQSIFDSLRAEGRAGLGASRSGGAAKSAMAADFATWAKSRGDELVADGIPQSKVDGELITAVVEEAVETTDLSVLGVLKMVTGEGGIPLSLSALGKTAHQAAAKTISVAEEKRYAEAEATFNRENAMTDEALKSSIYLAAEAGDFEAAERMTSVLALKDPDKAFTVQNHVNTRRERLEDKSKDGAFLAALSAVDGSSSYKEAEFFVNGLIKEGLLSYEDGDKALKKAQTRHGITEKSGVLDLQEGDRSFSSAIGSLDDIVTNADDYAKGDYLEPVAKAKVTLEDASLLWLEQNVNDDGQYDRLAYRDFLIKESERLRGQVTANAEGTPPPVTTTGTLEEPPATTTTPAPTPPPQPVSEGDPDEARKRFLLLFESDPTGN